MRRRNILVGLAVIAVCAYLLTTKFFSIPDPYTVDNQIAVPSKSQAEEAEWRMTGYLGFNLPALTPGAQVRVYALALTAPYLQYAAITGPVFVRRATVAENGGVDIILDIEPKTLDALQRASAVYPLAIGDDAQTFWAAPPEIATAVLDGRLRIAPPNQQSNGYNRSNAWSGSSFDCPGPGCPSGLLD